MQLFSFAGLLITALILKPWPAVLFPYQSIYGCRQLYPWLCESRRRLNPEDFEETKVCPLLRFGQYVPERQDPDMKLYTYCLFIAFHPYIFFCLTACPPGQYCMKHLLIFLSFLCHEMSFYFNHLVYVNVFGYPCMNISKAFGLNHRSTR